MHTAHILVLLMSLGKLNWSLATHPSSSCNMFLARLTDLNVLILNAKAITGAEMSFNSVQFSKLSHDVASGSDIT